jgi:hypothetical protein
MYIFLNTKKEELRLCTIHSIVADHIVRMNTGRRPLLRNVYLLKNKYVYQNTDAILAALLLTKDNTIKGKILKEIVQIVYALNEYVVLNRFFDNVYAAASKIFDRIASSCHIKEFEISKYIEEDNERFID